jgi:hypothetical protein
MYHYRHRAYDPAKGRFLQRDPLEEVDGPNLYTYVTSRPTSSVDPLGLLFGIIEGIAAGIGEVIDDTLDVAGDLVAGAVAIPGVMVGGVVGLVDKDAGRAVQGGAIDVGRAAGAVARTAGTAAATPVETALGVAVTTPAVVVAAAVGGGIDDGQFAVPPWLVRLFNGAVQAINLGAILGIDRSDLGSSSLRKHERRHLHEQMGSFGLFIPLYLLFEVIQGKDNAFEAAAEQAEKTK